VRNASERNGVLWQDSEQWGLQALAAAGAGEKNVFEIYTVKIFASAVEEDISRF